MAGVVAMASVIEDFDTQPCKKSRKDGGSPVVKTITNYFSPVVKPVEKPFSPPRSNSIMDYFRKKTPSSNEKRTSPEQAKENCQWAHSAEKHTEAGKQPPQKRGRKASKAARKLVAETAGSTEEATCMIVEHESKDSEAVGSHGVLGSDTAALLAQVSAEAGVTTETLESNPIVIDECTEEGEHQEDGFKSGNSPKLKPPLNTPELSPATFSSDEVKQVKIAARNPRKRQLQEVKHLQGEEKEAESSFSDASMEVNLDEVSQLNNSTVTISFEDFLRSQSQDMTEEEIMHEEGKQDETKVTTEELDTSEPPAFHTSPRTVKIQAEVHVFSTQQKKAKAAGQVASIFNSKKGANCPAEVISSPHSQEGEQLPSPIVKRKSNVVLQEEDLELLVLESESTPKCSEAERKQFMSVFKQPTRDGSKTKPAKSQGKQKQPAEKNLDAADKVGEDDSVIQPAAEQVSKGPKEKKAAKKKPTGRKAKRGKEAANALPAAVDETATSVVADDDKKEEPLTNSPHIVPTVRRSRREAVARQAPETSSPPPLRKTRKQTESKEALVTPLLQENPVQMSTPKTRKSKRDIFVAEVVCPPDAQESPIRIKFTRVHKRVSKNESGKNSSVTPKMSNETKKRKQAKKVVEKAKAIQQSQKMSVREKSNLRRSVRNEASIKRSYCEAEDSVICIEEDQTATPQQRAPGQGNAQKPLRSLNDVLGKATQAAKETKTLPGSKATSLGQEKTARKASTVISIFDESSREGSDKSQDDEQFRARMKFLKSGLPESFKKHIAKTAATKEAYALSCSSFQPVTHTMQCPTDCHLWNLPWPDSQHHLKELWSHLLKPLPPVSGTLCVKTVPANRSLCQRGLSQRPELSEGVRQLLLEEFRKSNPLFPAQIFMTRLLKKQQLSSTASEPEAVTRNTSLPAEPVGVKRKRSDDDGENSVKVAKKQRSNQDKNSTTDPEPIRRGGRPRRGQRSKLEEEEKAKPSLQSAPIPPEEDSVLIVDDLLLGKDTGKKGVVADDKMTSDAVREDALWTEKYQPQHSSDIVDNAASVRRLHSWLKEWKLRADREERRKQKEKKQEEGSSDWEGLEEDPWDGEDMLCNTMLITGPPGVGKTAAVYACAQELGFKVFEVNASSQRSGRLILSQLKEATQSHQVDSQGVNAHKPTYFNSYSTSGSSSAGSIRPGTSPRKINSPRRVVSSPRKHPQSPRGAKRGGLAPTSLANFFKMGRPPSKETHNTTVNEQRAASKKVVKANEPGAKSKELAAQTPTVTTPNEKSSEEQGKKTVTSLILFEEVDVIFEDDSGFLAAIKTFMTTTKRPVILTTSDPAFSTMFDGNFEEILFRVPSVANVSSYLQLLCMAENVRTDLSDIRSLLRLNGCDIRQSLLQLQFWTRSAGGYKERILQTVQHELKPENEGAADQPVTLPPCDTRCTESKLGLLNTERERDIWQLLQSNSLVEAAVCWDLLTECRQQGIDLIYSNMEALLPLPLTQLTASSYKQEQYVSASQDPSLVSKEQPCSSTQQFDTLRSHARLLHTTDSADGSDSGSPVKVSNRMMKKKKTRGCMPVQHGLHSDSDSEDGFLSLCKPLSAPQTKKEVHESLVSERVQRKPLTPEEREKNLPVSQSLESIADFLDDMSYIDSSLLYSGDVHRRMSCARAIIKDGMTDESRVDTDRGSCQTENHAMEIHAAVEALSFHKCRTSVAEAWNKAQQLDGEMGTKASAELTLPVAAHQKGYSFIQDGPTPPQLVQQRREVMESLLLRLFGTLSNKPAVPVDYLPVIRTICRSEQLKEQGKVKRRFLHYLDAIHLGLEKSTLQLLAEDFP
ncbi:ATPase family AAA domain-containing protein 5 isoform X2 [Parambassis ranga]|uniref:ATPase family AAA domain-containing protein 5 isoform X2 n=1 Tax=Parambassis ranga TaxID=210632 RepID=A0A6P7IK96_9TELE|nr:ATPase family AAA domain-containing protein 5 isoform X2 [Parambassis ranga]